MNKKDSLDEILNLVDKFAKERDWDQFHTPKNLIMAATSEIGELAEILQWKSDQEVITYLRSAEGKKRLSEEIADVMIYLIRLSQKSGIDLVDAVKQKIEINELKYPINFAKGNATKYSDRYHD